MFSQIDVFASNGTGWKNFLKKYIRTIEQNGLIYSYIFLKSIGSVNKKRRRRKKTNSPLVIRLLNE
jgi:hypothetical protein